MNRRLFTRKGLASVAAIALAATLITQTAAGAAVTTAARLPATDYSKLDTSKKLTINEFQWGSRDADKDDLIVKMLNQKFNVDFKINRVLSAEYQSAVNLRIAANDYPDIFRIKANSPTYGVLYEDDRLVNMSTYIDKYNLNNLKNYINEKEGIDAFKEDDGYYRMPTFKETGLSAFIMRQDWLDKYKAATSKGMPETYSDFRSYLKYVKDNKLGGVDTVPLTTYWTSTSGFLENLGDGFFEEPGWAKVNGEWTARYMTDGFKKMCAYYNQLYSEGLLDKEVFTLNETNAQSKMISGRVGMYVTLKGRYANIVSTAKDLKLTLMMTPLKGTKGIPVRTVEPSLTDPVLVTKKDNNENRISRIMALVDYLHDEKMINETLIIGFEGVTYKKAADGKITYITPAFTRDFGANGHLLSGLTDYSLITLYDPDPAIGELYTTSMKYARYDVADNYFHPVLTEYNNQLTILKNDWFAKFVTGAKSITNEKDYQDYVAEMKKNGYDKVQKVISDYLNKKAK